MARGKSGGKMMEKSMVLLIDYGSEEKGICS
jgi:hypothetical protein